MSPAGEGVAAAASSTSPAAMITSIATSAERTRHPSTTTPTMVASPTAHDEPA
jgi:hypothetical protein